MFDSVPFYIENWTHRDMYHVSIKITYNVLDLKVVTNEKGEAVGEVLTIIC